MVDWGWRGVEEQKTAEGHKLDDRYFHYFNYGDDFMGIHTCHNLLNCTL